MKMTYPLKSKSKSKYTGKIVLVIVLFFLFSLSLSLFGNKIRQISHTIATPLWFLSGVVTKPFVQIKDYFVFKNDLINKNSNLENELLRLKFKETDYNVLSQEFEDLKTQLGREASPSRIVSKILSKPPFSPYDTLIIDVGSLDGVALGNKVYISDNIIVGFIKNATPHTSLVELFSNGDSEQEATLSRTGASFLLKGQGGANLEVEVPKDTDVLWGDIFLYPKFGASMIGSVYYIDTSSQSSFKKIYIRVPGNIFSATYAFVEKSK